MADPRKVYSSTDTQPVTLYAKRNVDDLSSHPVIVNTNGAITLSGTVAIDQTTDGVTNGVSLTNDSITGTAGTPDAAVLTVQGVDSMRPLITTSPLAPKDYDYISLDYTGSNLTTVVFKTGGSGGTTISTLTLAYSGSTLTSVTKS